MDERFLNEMRREPRPEFARDLRERLRAQEQSRRGLGPGAFPALALAGATALAVALFTLPSVRASAQSLLDLFRVRRFAAVEFDEPRMERLRSLQRDNALMVFDRMEKVRDPGPARSYPSLEAAGAAAGIVVMKPGYLPNGLTLDSVFVEGAGEVRMSVDEAKLRTLLDQLELRDVAVPSGLSGKSLEVRKPPVVIQKYRAGNRRARLVQAMSPEVTVPSGVDVERMAEMGLRILGLDAGEARRVARATDWRTTLMVPVPMNASTFRQVTIHGEPGLLITMAGKRPGENRRVREGSILMWSEGDRVFGMMSNFGAAPDLVQMAESVR